MKMLQCWCIFLSVLVCSQGCIPLSSRKWESCNISPETQLELGAFFENSLNIDESISIGCVGEINGKDYLTFLKGTIIASDDDVDAIAATLIASDDIHVLSNKWSFSWFSAPIDEVSCLGFTQSGIFIACFKTEDPNVKSIFFYFTSAQYKQYYKVRDIYCKE